MECPTCKAENPAEVEVCFACGRHMTALTQGALIASRYEIVGLLGKGGMGMVYRAHDQLLDEMVAIKVLRNEFMGTPGMAERFRSEIKLARRVSHPNVCRIHEYGQAGAVNYISMALVEGTNLRTLLLRHPDGMPWEQAFPIAIQVADGLQAIHDVGIIHRDLKSANIVLEANGQVRLMDFGIAKESSGAGGLTAAGEVMGTPEYMSPEQCRGHSLDFRSDVYSLGIVIYEIFTGHVPFRGESVTATLLKQMEDPLPLAGPDKRAIPPAVAGLLRRALAKDAAARFASAAEVAEGLRQARLRPTEDESATPLSVKVVATKREPAEERRQHSRLGISVDVVLQRTTTGGAVLQEERTIADNIGRKGARVLTAMNLSPGENVVLREVGGGFQVRAAVRHVYKPEDRIQRIGLEFLDGSAPDRLVPTDADTQRGVPRVTPASSPAAATPVPAEPVQPSAALPPATPPPPVAPTATERPATLAPASERRRGSRLEITMDVVLKRLGPAGQTLQEERTVADNVSREGARLMTTMTSLAPGDVILIEEVGSDFRTRATVRASYQGKDRIHRLGIEFLDQMAPDRLVAGEDSKPRLPRPRPAAPAEPPAPAREDPEAARLRERRTQIEEAYKGLKGRNYFEVLGVPRAASAAQVKEAYVRLARQFHPDARKVPGLADLEEQAEAVFHAIATAHEVLLDPSRRMEYELKLGRERRTPKSMAAAVSPAAPVGEGPQVALRKADQALRDGRKHFADGQYLDAIHRLEKVADLAAGSRTNQEVRLLLAQAMARSPKGQKRAEEILLALVAEDESLVEARVVLGLLYRAGGKASLAEAEFLRVLEIMPGHHQAVAELRSIRAAEGDSGS